MAHTVFLTRGEKHFVDRFISELSTRYLATKRRDPKDNKIKDALLQLRLSPIQLWDLSYPKEYRDVVHNHLFGETKGMPINKRCNKFIAILRKILGLKKVEDYEKTHKLSMKDAEHIELIAVGVKDDYWIKSDGTTVSEKDKTDDCTEGI